MLSYVTSLVPRSSVALVGDKKDGTHKRWKIQPFRDTVAEVVVLWTHLHIGTIAKATVQKSIHHG